MNEGDCFGGDTIRADDMRRLHQLSHAPLSHDLTFGAET